MRRSADIMGTGVSLDIPGADEYVFEKVFEYLRELDARYSPYKKDSEVSRYARGEIKTWRLNRELKKIIKACRSAEAATDGAFSAWASGTFDPSGYVKGWSIEQASKIIEKNGYKTYCLAIGGDMKAAGDKTWQVGIQDPNDRNKILLVVKLKNKAIATSGAYIRGGHIINPKTKKPASGIKQVSVIGPSIIDADVLATSAFVLGEFAANFIGGQAKNYEAIVVDGKNRIEATSGAANYIDEQ